MISALSTMSDGAERWQRLEDVVQAALERPTTERAAFLAEACGGNEELRREAASLIDRDAHAEGFLAMPIGEMAAHAMTYSPGGTQQPDPSREMVGRRIGSYEIARYWARAAWEKSIAHTTIPSAATWRSRCSPQLSPQIANAWRDSSAKRACWRP